MGWFSANEQDANSGESEAGLGATGRLGPYLMTGGQRTGMAAPAVVLLDWVGSCGILHPWTAARICLRRMSRPW
jgi:hypothetical protein